ncbi:MAG: DUF3105 domain-containing protein [Acidimicrobiales bacterium]
MLTWQSRTGRTLGTLAALSVSAVGLLGACGGDDDDGDAVSGDGDGSLSVEDTTSVEPLPLNEVLTYDVASNNHVTVRVDYPQTPPVGGDHAPVWQNCGFYDQPIFSEAGVHSLEHGAVWITYEPGLPAEQVDQVEALANQPYTLASPWTETQLGAPIVLSAWGAQLAVDALPAAAVDQFLATYREAATSPEPGAPCTGGASETR